MTQNRIRELERQVKEKDKIIARQKNEIKALKKEVADLKTRCQNYEQAYNELLHEVKQLKRQLFGRSSERYIAENTEKKTIGGSEKDKLEKEAAPEEERPSRNVIDIKVHQRKKKGNKTTHCRSELRLSKSMKTKGTVNVGVRENSYATK